MDIRALKFLDNLIIFGNSGSQKPTHLEGALKLRKTNLAFSPNKNWIGTVRFQIPTNKKDLTCYWKKIKSKLPNWEVTPKKTFFWAADKLLDDLKAQAVDMEEVLIQIPSGKPLWARQRKHMKQCLFSFKRISLVLPLILEQLCSFCVFCTSKT